ncbi:hypothetical protein RHSIM_Rhsim02G0147200 [Rhododendron simsii]|uniref:BED-type domain-containing protein n=1 Tax=Rhododendron simsii TaxID=118357 RepID=A0A834H955_RHOSS|nr:hypothetical protein RHSIM_Rhsim02G0147200 [Rhododendron simsii]
MDSSNFDFTLCGELEDDVVDVEEVELGGNSNPPVSTNADVIDVQDDTIVEVGQNTENRLKRKVPPREPKPKKEPGKRYRSPYWDHFNEIKENEVTKWAECKYCNKRYAAESKKHGVSNLKAHIPACPLYPNRDQHGQQNLSFRPTDGGGVDVVTHVFSFDDCKRALAEMVIIDELPFRFVEGIGFRKFCKVMQPKFSSVSRQTITRDNASSNATAIEYLKRKTMDWKKTVLEHEYIHRRCCAHILNLIVAEGLKDTSESILRVRDVVRYVKSSPQRMETFNKYMEKEKIKSQQTVCLDVCTRWNSTYLMLEVAIKFKKAFQRMGEEDSSFIKKFGIKEGEEDLSLELEGLVAMDPRFKLRWVKFFYTKSKGKAEGEKMEKKVKDVLNRLYDSYAKEGEVRQNVSSASPMPRVENEDCDSHLNLAMEFDTYLEEEYSSVCSSEVDKYLGDLCERRDNLDFDILMWWKNNSNKYPILSKIARDVLAVPVSTIASESAFSTGGRILDPFRSSLSPSMVETLVCTQNWLLSTVPISLRQAMDKVEDFERGSNFEHTWELWGWEQQHYGEWTMEYWLI